MWFGSSIWKTGGIALSEAIRCQSMFSTPNMHHNFVDLNRSYFYLHAADLCADSQLIKINFQMEFLELDQRRGSGLVTLTLSMLNPFCVWEPALNGSLSA